MASTYVVPVAAQLRDLTDLLDPVTFSHSARVARYAYDLAVVAGLGLHTAERLHLAGLVHDLGKSVWPEDLASGAVKELDGRARTMIADHPLVGAAMVEPVDDDLAEIVVCHHEKFEGGGYPSGSPLSDLPVTHRILPVADIYAAVVEPRLYHSGQRTPAQAQQLLAQLGSSRELDPDLVAAFLAHLRDSPADYQAGIMGDPREEFDLRLNALAPLPGAP